jgi:thioredoxin-dependent adenylylsulfate APS reductase
MSQQFMIDEYEAGELSILYESEPAEELIGWAIDQFGDRLSISHGGGVEGMVILDMAWRIEPRVRVFALDTGRLPQESFDLIDAIRSRYGIAVEVISPQAAHVEGMVQRHGTNLMYQAVDMRLLCCQVRKVQPLNRYLAGVDAWVTGVRREQWASRAEVRKLELDHDHGGIVKINPLADWTKTEVWNYIRTNEVPYHAQYDQGYTSIGCTPCTRAVQAGEQDRAGRWWWETNAPKECGIHCAIYTGGFEHELHALLKDGEH